MGLRWGELDLDLDANGSAFVDLDLGVLVRAHELSSKILRSPGADSQAVTGSQVVGSSVASITTSHVTVAQELTDLVGGGACEVGLGLRGEQEEPDLGHAGRAAESDPSRMPPSDTLAASAAASSAASSAWLLACRYEESGLRPSAECQMIAPLGVRLPEFWAHAFPSTRECLPSASHQKARQRRLPRPPMTCT